MKKKLLQSGARLLVDSLTANDVDIAFGVPGESYLAVLNELYESQKIKFITCRHEGGAAMMADAYGKLQGRPGICFVTRGPGATNASSGIHVAFQDSTPLILFVGQVSRSMMDREGFQEIDYRRMFGQMSKWTAQIEDASRIPEYVSRAFYTSMAGRPGPVVLALPEDMLSELAPSQNLQPAKKLEAHSGPKEISEFKLLLEKAKNPLFILGGNNWTSETCQKFESF